MNLLALGQCVADLENTIVGQTNNVTGIGFVDGGLALGHKLSGGGEAYSLSQPNVKVGLVADKLAGAHLAECDTRTVVGVDVGRYLEDEACELGLCGQNQPLLGFCGPRTGRNLDKAVEQFLHTKVVECRTEKYRGDLSAAVLLDVEFRIDTVDEFQVASQLIGFTFTDVGVEFCRIDVYGYLFGDALLVGGEEVELLFIDVVYSFEPRSLSYGPR